MANPENDGYPRLGQAFLLVFLLLLATLAVSLIVFLLAGLTGSSSKSLPKVLGYSLPLMLIIFYGLIRKVNKNAGDPGFYFSKFDWRLIPFFLFIALTIVLITEPLTALIPMPKIFADIFEEAFTMDTASLMMVVIIAPLLEEMLFRGIILDGFLHQYKPGKAIVWSAFIFGFVHLNPWQFIPAFCLGLFFGWVYWKIRSLWPVIFLHGFVNLMGTVLYLYTEDASATTADLFPDISSYIMLLIFCFAGSWLLFRFLMNRFARKTEPAFSVLKYSGSAEPRSTGEVKGRGNR